MRRRWAFDERHAWACLTVAMATAAVVILFLGRGTTFWTDELVLYVQSPVLDLEQVLRPHVGHFVPVTRLYYKGMFEVFGTSYFPFRLMGLFGVLLTVGLLFVYLKRRVHPFVALAPCLVLLFFGSDALHVLVGNAFGVLVPMSCGIGALLALERCDRRGDALAALLLTLAIGIYSVSLAFVAAAAVAIVLGRRSYLRLWVVALPVGIYGAWWLWQRSKGFGDSAGIDWNQILLLPSWGFQSLSAVFGALSGLDYNLGSGHGNGHAGAIIAAAALVGLGWRLSRGRVPAALWPALTVVIVLWILGTLTASAGRTPDSARYLFTGSIAVLLVAAEALRGARVPRAGVLALYLLVAAGISVNLYMLGTTGRELRNEYAVRVHSTAGALDIVGDSALDDFTLPETGNRQGFGTNESPFTFPFGVARGEERSTTGAYLEAAERYGSVGYSEAEIDAQSDEARAEVDAVMAAALGLQVEVAPANSARSECKVVAAQEGFASSALPAGGASLEPEAASGPVWLRRFASEQYVELGEPVEGAPTLLTVPTDSSSRPWWVFMPAESVRICSLR